MRHDVLPQMLLAQGQMTTLLTLEPLHLFVRFQMFLHIGGSGEIFFAAWVQAFKDIIWPKTSVRSQVLLEVKWALQPFAAEDAHEGIKRVQVVFMCLQ